MPLHAVKNKSLAIHCSLAIGTFECLKRKKLTTPTRIDKPVLRLSKAKSDGKTRTSSKPNIKFNAETDKNDRPKRKGVARDQKHNKPDAKKPASTNLLSRIITFNILVAVDEGIHLDKALAANQALPKVDDRDRRFVRLLVTTSLSLSRPARKGADTARGTTPVWCR